MLFEKLSLVVGRAAGHAPVNEVEGPAVRGEHAHGAPFDHAVEIAGPGLGDLGERETESPFLGRRLCVRSGRRQAHPNDESSQHSHRHLTNRSTRE
jgi:hypothetical protein